MANWSTKVHKKGMGKSTSAYGKNATIKKGWNKCIRKDTILVIKEEKNNLLD